MEEKHSLDSSSFGIHTNINTNKMKNIEAKKVLLNFYNVCPKKLEFYTRS